jgi:hypothetical protein
VEPESRDELASLLLDIVEFLDRTEKRCRGWILPPSVRDQLKLMRDEGIRTKSVAWRALKDLENTTATKEKA